MNDFWSGGPVRIQGLKKNRKFVFDPTLPGAKQIFTLLSQIFEQIYYYSLSSGDKDIPVNKENMYFLLMT